MDPITAGAAVVSPWMPLATEGIKALGTALGGSGPAAPSSSNGNAFDTKFDSSGWNVNFGGGSITSDRTSSDTKTPLGMDLGGNTGLIVLGLLGIVVAWKLLRKKS